MGGAFAVVLFVASPPILSLSDALARAGQNGAVLVARAEAEVARLQVERRAVPASPVVSLGTTRYAAAAVAKATARRRVRPILMTTFCTVFGLLPLALGLGTAGEMQRPLAIAVAGGLLVSTAATLFVLPSFVAGRALGSTV